MEGVHRNSFWQSPRLRGRWRVVSVGKFVTLKPTLPGLRQQRVPFQKFKESQGSDWIEV